MKTLVFELERSPDQTYLTQSRLDDTLARQLKQLRIRLIQILGHPKFKDPERISHKSTTHQRDQATKLSSASTHTMQQSSSLAYRMATLNSHGRKP